MYFPAEDGTPARMQLVRGFRFESLLLTGNGGTELEGDVGSSLKDDEGNWLGWKSWDPLDLISLASGNDLAPGWLGDHVKASGLGDDGGGGGECQKAGLDDGVLHTCVVLLGSSKE